MHLPVFKMKTLPVFWKRLQERAGRIHWAVRWGVLAILLTRLLLPVFLERGAAFGSRYYLGLPARLGNVDLFLLQGKIIVEDLSVGSVPDGIAPFKAALLAPEIDQTSALLHLDRLSFGWSWLQLFTKKVRVTEFVLQGPRVRVLREADGQIDPLRYAVPVAQASPRKPAPESSQSKGWPLEVQRFLLQAPDLAILEGAEKLLEFSLESFELADFSLKGSEIGLGSVGVHAPMLRVRHKLMAGGAAGSAPAQAEPQSAGASAKPGLRVEKIDMERAKFTWINQKGPLDVLLTLKAAGITAEQGKRFPLELALQIGPGKFALAGEVGITPLFYKGKVSWEQLSLQGLLLAAAPELGTWLRSADASGELNVTADIAGAEGPAGIQLSGRAAIDRFAFANPGAPEVSVGWKHFGTEVKRAFLPVAQEGTTVAEIGSITLVEPQGLYTTPAPSLQTLGSSAQQTPAAAPSAGSAKKRGPVEFTLGQFELTGGEFEVRDATAAGSCSMRELNINLREARFPEPKIGALALQATLPVASKLSIEGNLMAGQNGTFLFNLQKLDLPTFSPYTKKAGVTLDAGKASLQTKVESSGDLIKASNQLVLNQFGVSLRDPDSFAKQFGVPIDLALALLRDPAGDIKLSVPVSMNKKGAKVSASAVLGSAMKAAILGAISSPLKLLGAAGGAVSGIAPIKCAPGTSELVLGSAQRAESFVKLLSGRPNMRLLVRGRTGPEDRPVLAGQILLERVEAGQGWPEVPEAGFLARRRISHHIEKLLEGEKAVLEKKDLTIYEGYLASVQVPEERLRQLAKERAEKVLKLLATQGAPPERLSVAEPPAEGEPGVEIVLQ